MINSFSDKLSGTIESIRNHLIENKLINVDETGCRINGKLEWMQIFANDMFTLFSHKELLANDDYFSQDEINASTAEYDDIIKSGFAEYEAAIEGKTSIRYFNDEKCLLNRLKEFSKEHLMFVMTPEVSCGNNVAERGTKEIKRKIKVSGVFRSDTGANNYARAASAISTFKKQKLKLFDTILGVFNGIVPEFLHVPPQ